jgi:formylglycine-generating enzyme required for sulfatase activity
MFTRLFILIFLSSGAFAQTGTLKVVAYANGTIKIDGEVKCSIVANEVKKFDLKADDYIVQFFPQSGSSPITKEVSIQVGKSETINFEVSAPNQQNNNTTNNSNLLLPEMVFVQGGTFTMGCTAEQGTDCWDNEKPAHTVTLSSFYIGKYEVTQAQWEAVMGDNPSEFKYCENCPVENVNWNDCQVFIQKLNAKTGKNYRLPTEAEWEYAARGGNMSKGYKYAGSSVLDDVAWYEGTSNKKTYPVGQKLPNELGIYDMSGNVDEWCSDYWKDSYNAFAENNPRGPEIGDYHVFRGGSWIHVPSCCEVWNRHYYPDFRNENTGFRLVLVPSSK